MFFVVAKGEKGRGTLVPYLLSFFDPWEICNLVFFGKMSPLYIIWWRLNFGDKLNIHNILFLFFHYVSI